MANDPVQYPLDAPTIVGTTLTIDELLLEPERITRDIADLTMQRFYMDRVFTPGGGVTGGSILFERPNPLATDLYGDREPKEVAPSGEFPLQTFQRGVPMIARPKKIGNKWFVTREAAKRNNPRVLTRNMRRTANTIRRRIENMGISELQAVVAAEARFRSGTSWSAYAGTAMISRNGTTGPVADILSTMAAVDLEERGIELDSIILHTNEAQSIQQAYPGQSIRQVLSLAADEEFGMTISNVFITPRYTAGRALLFASGQVGEWRNEFPLMEETEWEGVAAGGRQRWWYQWSISPMFFVDDQFAMIELRGIA
jgi:hypothetical protein